MEEIYHLAVLTVKGVMTVFDIHGNGTNESLYKYFRWYTLTFTHYQSDLFSNIVVVRATLIEGSPYIYNPLSLYLQSSVFICCQLKNKFFMFLLLSLLVDFNILHMDILSPLTTLYYL